MFQFVLFIGNPCVDVVLMMPLHICCTYSAVWRVISSAWNPYVRSVCVCCVYMCVRVRVWAVCKRTFYEKQRRTRRFVWLTRTLKTPSHSSNLRTSIHTERWNEWCEHKRALWVCHSWNFVECRIYVGTGIGSTICLHKFDLDQCISVFTAYSLRSSRASFWLT